MKEYITTRNNQLHLQTTGIKFTHIILKKESILKCVSLVKAFLIKLENNSGEVSQDDGYVCRVK